MKVSVIIPAYHLGPYVHECLLSFLAQKTDFPFEVIVCDDCSQDETRRIIGLLEDTYSSLVVIRNEKNQGLVETMRTLLTRARGQYIAYCDGDDIALPGKLQIQAEYMDAHPGCSISYHESDVFDSDTGKHLKDYTAGFYNYKYIPQAAGLVDLVKYTVFLQASTVMVRNYAGIEKSVDHGNRIICDYPWHIINAGQLGGSVDFIDRVLGRYRIHDASFGARTTRDVERRIAVAEELASACRIARHYGVSEADITLGVNHIFFSAALYFLKLDEFEYFQAMIKRSVCDYRYFDDRHRYAFEHRNDPGLVKRRLMEAS